MKNLIKSYSFWVSLSGAIVVLVESLGKAIGFIPDGKLINDIVMAIAGFLVVLGVVAMPVNNKTDEVNSQNDGNIQILEDESVGEPDKDESQDSKDKTDEI